MRLNRITDIVVNGKRRAQAFKTDRLPATHRGRIGLSKDPVIVGMIIVNDVR